LAQGLPSECHPSQSHMFCRSSCHPSNPATDSVKVDSSVMEKACRDVEKARQEADDEQQVHEWNEEERCSGEEPKLGRPKEKQWLEQEEQERLKEQQRRMAEEECARRWEQEEKLRFEREEQEQQRTERLEVLNHFCAQNGFSGINDPRRSGCAVWGAATTYPLHRAAELGDERIVALLLKEGAATLQKDSSGRTAAQVAWRKDKGGSHKSVLRLLAVPVGRSGAGGA